MGFAGRCGRHLRYRWSAEDSLEQLREYFLSPADQRDIERYPWEPACLTSAAVADDSFNLQRFVEAQEVIYAGALAEIRRGAKRSQWMWFVFPQLRGLGRSEMANRYGITSLDEAKAYLTHPVLSPRMRECAAALQDLTSRTAVEVFGEVDATKLRSSLTLFARADGEPIFQAALNRWFGEEDGRTLVLLGLR